MKVLFNGEKVHEIRIAEFPDFYLVNIEYGKDNAVHIARLKKLDR